ncbi:hypothetical protein L596_015071 [Steinernema carpocapsae]|nr:hypothetical protein L596_015071 [Steinernema carpocapsae]
MADQQEILHGNCRKLATVLTKREKVVNNYEERVNTCYKELQGQDQELEDIKKRAEDDLIEFENQMISMWANHEYEMKEIQRKVRKCEKECLDTYTRQIREKEIMTSTVKDLRPKLKNLLVTAAATVISLLCHGLFLTAKLRDAFVGK